MYFYYLYAICASESDDIESCIIGAIKKNTGKGSLVESSNNLNSVKEKQSEKNPLAKIALALKNDKKDYLHKETVKPGDEPELSITETKNQTSKTPKDTKPGPDDTKENNSPKNIIEVDQVANNKTHGLDLQDTNNEDIGPELRSALAEKIGYDGSKDFDSLKTKRWGVVIEKKDKNNHIKTIKKIEIAIELLSTQSKTILENGAGKTIERKPEFKTVIGRIKPPFRAKKEDSEANKKLLKNLVDLLHISRSVKKSDISKHEPINAKIVELPDDKMIENNLNGAEKFDKEFETANGGLHILYTIANNVKTLKKDWKFKKNIERINGILIYEKDGIYHDYWDKLTFAKDKDKYTDETDIFEGMPVNSYEEIIEKGNLTPIGFYQSKDLTEDDHEKHFKTIKNIIRELAKERKVNIPELFRENNKIPIIDRLIFARAYKNTLGPSKQEDNYVKVCVCDDSFCIKPCEQIRWVKKNNLE